MASIAVAAFVPAELRPDHFVAAGKLTQAELLARALGHGRLLSCLSCSACCHHTRSFLIPRPRCHPGSAEPACNPDTPHPSATHNRHGTAASPPQRWLPSAL